MSVHVKRISFEKISYGPDEGKWTCEVVVADISKNVHKMTFSPSNPKSLIDLLIPDIVSELCNLSEDAYMALRASIYDLEKFKEIWK